MVYGLDDVIKLQQVNGTGKKLTAEQLKAIQDKSLKSGSLQEQAGDYKTINDPNFQNFDGFTRTTSNFSYSFFCLL